MIRLFAGCWMLFMTNLLEAEVVSITGYSITLGTYYPADPSTGTGEHLNINTGYFYSSVSVVAVNNPFHPTSNHMAPGVFFVTHEEYNQSMGTRFLDVVGIPETMINDIFTNPFGFQQSTERPFFNMIDTEVLVGLVNWNWDGQLFAWAGGLAGYITPSAEGIFNQAEQRFYLSDGRQYQVVPEPSLLSLLFAGGTLLMAGRRRKQN